MTDAADKHPPDPETTTGSPNEGNPSLRTIAPTPHQRGELLRRKQLQRVRDNVLRRNQHGFHHHPWFSAENLPWYTVSENSYYQQRSRAWEVIFDYELVGKMCLVFSILLVPLGACCLLLNSTAKDFKVNYGEECKSSRNYLRLLRRSCVFCSGGHNPTCVKEVNLEYNMKTPVYLYYELDNFYQNHRSLIKSVDNQQLRGDIFKTEENSSKLVPVPPSSDCTPYAEDSNGKYYFPCGAMARAMFNDDFALKTAKGETINLRKEGISHSVLKKVKFRNPPGVTPKNYDYKKKFVDSFVKPEDWSREVWDEWWEDGGLENERFINWMVPSAKPRLRKLYGIIESVPGCPPGVFCKGNYLAEIEYRFDVDPFSGKKALIFSTTSFMGSRNLFLPIFSILMGLVQAALGFYFLKEMENLHNSEGRDDTDEDDNDENNEQNVRKTVADKISKRSTRRKSRSRGNTNTRRVMFKMDKKEEDGSVSTVYRNDKESTLDRVGSSHEELDGSSDSERESVSSSSAEDDGNEKDNQKEKKAAGLL